MRKNNITKVNPEVPVAGPPAPPKGDTAREGSPKGSRPRRRREGEARRGGEDHREAAARRGGEGRREAEASREGDGRRGGDGRRDGEARRGGEGRRDDEGRRDIPRGKGPLSQPSQPQQYGRREKGGEGRSANRPTINCMKDMNSGTAWAKGLCGPSFADIVRQKHEEKALASATAASAKKSEKPATPRAQTPYEEIIQLTTREAESDPTMADAAPVPAARPVEEPPASFLTSRSYYVLEIERVDRVKLPANIKAAGMQSGMYVFSAQAGKPPTPPAIPQAQVQPQTLYHPDGSNLGGRPWGISGTETRVQPQAQPQQHHWNAAPSQPLEYWSGNTFERSNAARANHTQMQYSSYPASNQAPQQLRGPNFFPSRLRTSDVTDTGLRQTTSALFSRPTSTSNTGNVW